MSERHERGRTCYTCGTRESLWPKDEAPVVWPKGHVSSPEHKASQDRENERARKVLENLNQVDETGRAACLECGSREQPCPCELGPDFEPVFILPERVVPLGLGGWVQKLEDRVRELEGTIGIHESVAQSWAKAELEGPDTVTRECAEAMIGLAVFGYEDRIKELEQRMDESNAVVKRSRSALAMVVMGTSSVLGTDYAQTIDDVLNGGGE